MKQRYRGMQQTSGDVLQKRTIVRKKTERDFPTNEIASEKPQPQPRLMKEPHSKPKEKNIIGELSYFDRRRHAVVVPSIKDILCGRGKSFFNYEGNKQFRNIVNSYR